MYRHSAPADGSPGPQQFYVDFVNVVRIFAKQIIGYLFGVSVNALAARTFRVAKADAGESIPGVNFRDDNRHFGQGFLATGQHFGIADGGGQRQKSQRQFNVVNAVTGFSGGFDAESFGVGYGFGIGA